MSPVTATDVHKYVTWALRQIADFMLDHDALVGRIRLEWRGLRVKLEVERVEEKADGT